MARQLSLWLLAAGMAKAGTIDPRVQPATDVQVSPPMTNIGEAEDVVSMTDAFIKSLTLEEKASVVDGVQGACAGNVKPIPRVNFTGMCLQDSPLGVREADYVSVFPAGITAGASWDKNLIYKRGLLMADEFRAKGINVALSPVVGPLGRSAQGGRNWEGFAMDPYLSGIAAAETIRGFSEKGVQSTIKHWIANEQEIMRNPLIDVTTGQIIQDSVSSNVDDRTMHELYMWPFAIGLRAGATHVMCSYQRLNQTYACENSKSLNGLLKTELGFQGAVMSDWFAVHSSIPSINGGLDWEMPGGTYSPYFTNMTQYIKDGLVTEARLDDMVRRIMTPYFRFRQNTDDFPDMDPSLNEFKIQSVAANPTVFLPSTPEELQHFKVGGEKNRDVRKDHHKFVRELGSAGAVLLKNNAALPLGELKNIAVFGNDAADQTEGQFALNALERYGPEFGTNAGGGGSGTARFSTFVSPLEAIKKRMGKGLTQYILDNALAARTIGSIYPPPEACIVFVKGFMAESFDRDSLDLDWNGDGVVDTVSQSCSNTIVVTHVGGPVNMPWAENPNVTAIIAAHLPGQEVGNSIVDILWGDVNPSGKLPYTIAKDKSHYNAPTVNLTASDDVNAWQSNFTEGLLTDYRYFDAANIEPMYEFGFGLSYTSFSLKLGSVSLVVNPSHITPFPRAKPTEPGGNPALFETFVTVDIQVFNTGKAAGAAVPQLYLSYPNSAPTGTPLRVLRGFDKTKTLEPGETQSFTFEITRKDLSIWDVQAQDWHIPVGDFTFNVGFSSRDLIANATLAVI